MYRSNVLVCGGTGCSSSNSQEIMRRLEEEIKKKGLDKEVNVVCTGCFGLCSLGPVVIVYPEGSFYSKVTLADIPEIVEEHLLKGRIVKRLLYQETIDNDAIHSLTDTPFYKKQKRIALRNCGVINPEVIEEYIAMDGYSALGKVLTEMKPEEVDYINVHGTSTPVGDISEVKAIKKVFGQHAYDLNISSTKSMTGHLLGAAGAIEAMICVKSVENDIVPPTINFTEGDEDPEIDYKLNFTFNKAQKRTVNVALSNTFGFGGHNASIIVKKFVK